MINKGLTEALKFSGDSKISQLLKQLLSQMETQMTQIRVLNQIGMALSAEKDMGRLFEMIIDEARTLTNADGGTLYIMNEEFTELRFAIVQNESLNVRMGGTGGEITWDPVKLLNPDGSKNYQNVSAYAALSGEVVNISDVYHAEGFNFEGTRNFDLKTGYRSKSMLVVPMRNYENDVIGVLQILNCQDALTGKAIPFSKDYQAMTESLASQAAVALCNKKLLSSLEDLLDSFITSIASAIDEKSPYTGGHVRRVVDIAMTIAKKINETEKGVFKETFFSNEELDELRLAGWLHDVGKITTPEHVVDKATKLETVYDRIELIKTRFEVLKRDAMIELLRESGRKTKGEENPEAQKRYENKVRKLEEDLVFLINGNIGSEFMADEKLEILKTIAENTWELSGETKRILSDDEVRNLSIRKGTLNDEEREIINNHATVTLKMLSQLPLPKKFKNMPYYAAAHHERLDGRGYPKGLREEELPLQARILALADVFEALTAKDRPYKKGKTLSEAMKILGFMVKDKHLDPDLFELFVQEKFYLDYAERELTREQIDTDFISL